MTKADRAASGTFETDGYRLLPGLLSARTAGFLHDYAIRAARSGKLDQGDQYVPDAPCRYAEPLMEALLNALLPRIAGESGLRLFPTYSYFRIYPHGAVLKAHRDRPACEVSVTINLGHDASSPWPLWIQANDTRTAIELQPGDGLMYKGIDVAHWREPFTGRQSVQVFLHYVDQNGPYKDLKFDSRRQLSTTPGAERTLAVLMAN